MLCGSARLRTCGDDHAADDEHDDLGDAQPRDETHDDRCECGHQGNDEQALQRLRQLVAHPSASRSLVRHRSSGYGRRYGVALPRCG